MKRLKIHHSTVYRYRQPVTLGEHRLMFRPRDSHDLRYVKGTLTTSPPATVRWFHDVFSNSIAVATFAVMAERLEFVSDVVVDQYVAFEQASDFPIAIEAMTLPFAYSPQTIVDLESTVRRHYPDDGGKVEGWVRQFVDPAGATRTLELLGNMTREINHQFRYQGRWQEGVQTPAETLTLGSGSCRDLALLMMEAVRSLGLAARFVSGYLYDPAIDGQHSGYQGSGDTHAWVQVFLPGAGWVEFDPTNGIVGNANLIRVAVARDPSQALPLKGTYVGAADDFIAMDVTVTVELLPY